MVFSKTKAEHYEHLQIVLRPLRDHQLYANKEECKFIQLELQFLGHVVGSQGLQLDPRRTSIVQDWPTPSEITALQKFWGLANYFRKFVMGWAVLVSSLQVSLKKTNDYVWTQDSMAANNGAKDALTHALPDLHRPFQVICDACGIGLGAVLLQDGRPIVFEIVAFESVCPLLSRITTWVSKSSWWYIPSSCGDT